MIKDEDVIKSTTGQYMKPHERVLYNLALVFGILLTIAGIVMLFNSELLVWGIVLILFGISEMVGVGLLLWTEGEKKRKNIIKNKKDIN